MSVGYDGARSWSSVPDRVDDNIHHAVRLSDRRGYSTDEMAQIPCFRRRSRSKMWADVRPKNGSSPRWMCTRADSILNHRHCRRISWSEHESCSMLRFCRGEERLSTYVTCTSVNALLASSNILTIFRSMGVVGWTHHWNDGTNNRVSYCTSISPREST